MALTLTITDNGDGSGATAAIAGGAAAADNMVFVQPLSDLLPAGEELGPEERTGNGAVALDLDAGHYAAWCLSIDGDDMAVSQLQVFAVTDGTESVFRRILLAVQAKIRLLALTGITSANVVIRSVVTERNLTYPAVEIAPGRRTPINGVLNSNDYTYDVIVAILAADNQTPDATAAYTAWAEQLGNAFDYQRLSGVAEVNRCVISPGDAVDRQGWDMNRFLGLTILKFSTRETRGT